MNVCVGVGSFVSEDSSTEKAIQFFCTVSFMILLNGQNTEQVMLQDEGESHSSRTFGEILNSRITKFSCLYQNLPFLVIRIVIWKQYQLYSLGFLVKNLTVIVLSIAILVKNRHIFKLDFRRFLECLRSSPRRDGWTPERQSMSEA